MSRRKVTSRGHSPRKVNIRNVKSRFLIVCEGEKTEPNYFKSFRVPKKVVDVHGLGENPSKLVKSAKELNDQDGDYDQVWLVFDRDSWTPQDFNSAISSAKSAGFKIAYSNEAFELWYILHFEYLNTPTSRQDYGAKLTKLLGRKYEKNSENMYNQLLNKQHSAIENAKRLLKQYSRHNPEKDNPATTVHLLVKELNKFIS
jgi:serine/threonine protein phosphatase PrpC